VLFDGANQNYILLFFHTEKSKKYVKTTQKSCFSASFELKFEKFSKLNSKVR